MEDGAPDGPPDAGAIAPPAPPAGAAALPLGSAAAGAEGVLARSLAGMGPPGAEPGGDLRNLPGVPGADAVPLPPDVSGTMAVVSEKRVDLSLGLRG